MKEGEVFYNRKTAKVFHLSRLERHHIWCNKELYGVCAMMAAHLSRNTGLLAIGEFPYTWAQFAKEVEVTRTTIYKWREKLLIHGFVREFEIDGRTWIALNPNLFGCGEKVPYFVIKGFEKPYKKVEDLKKTAERWKEFAERVLGEKDE